MEKQETANCEHKPYIQSRMVRFCVRSPHSHRDVARFEQYSNLVFQFVQNALTLIYFLVALAVERYFAILKPFVHMKRASKSLF